MTDVIKKNHDQERAFAILIVLILLSILIATVGGFVFAVRIESHLASRAQMESQLLWMGLSGVELAKFILAESIRITSGNHTSLNQIWAGGPGEPEETNGPLSQIQLTNIPCGGGRISIKLIDLERFANINRADPILLSRAFQIIGLDLHAATVAVDSILDWIDPDDNPRPNGVESDFYLRQPFPYTSKNGPVDDLGELIFVHGLSPEMVWGALPPIITDPFATFFAKQNFIASSPKVGLAALFTPISSGLININTASPLVLQLLPGVDEQLAHTIQLIRAGPDGIEGTEDDRPFISLAELTSGAIPGLPPPEVVATWRNFITVQSRTFSLQATVKLGRVSRTYYAILIRLNPMLIETVAFWWD